MKKWKKLVALALAAILAMSLLTACGGGGGGSSLGSQIEAAVIAGVNNARSANAPKLSNDSRLRNKCVDALNHIQNGKVQYQYVDQFDLGGNAATAYFEILAMPIEENFTNGYTPRGTTLVTPQAITLDDAKQFEKEMVGEMDEDADYITAFGVATRTIDGKVYLALAFRMEGSIDE